MNRRNIAKITIPLYGRWTKRPDADGDCCEKHRKAFQSDRKRKLIADGRKIRAMMKETDDLN